MPSPERLTRSEVERRAMEPTPEVIARFREDMAGPEYPSSVLPWLPRGMEWDLWRLPEEPTWDEMIAWDREQAKTAPPP